MINRVYQVERTVFQGPSFKSECRSSADLPRRQRCWRVKLTQHATPVSLNLFKNQQTTECQTEHCSPVTRKVQDNQESPRVRLMRADRTEPSNCIFKGCVGWQRDGHLWSGLIRALGRVGFYRHNLLPPDDAYGRQRGMSCPH
ncbi:hypothetical protein E1301_Tti011551 [Triplophysa tibetana]|uniref:Uncharacterized protein n=1 Tax=Triplophysa tibetana TaxID=1572043 RepID=A0A5A9PI86_9TELE|nr:hypothetical protein E1301_Tti011551 [Triplophysa tibetana]